MVRQQSDNGLIREWSENAYRIALLDNGQTQVTVKQPSDSDQKFLQSDN